jgi:hypothetical protein
MMIVPVNSLADILVNVTLTRFANVRSRQCEPTSFGYAHYTCTQESIPMSISRVTGQSILFISPLIAAACFFALARAGES